MHRLVLLLIVMGMQFLVQAQGGENPFDLSSSSDIKSEVIQQGEDEAVVPIKKGNPFDLGDKGQSSREDSKSETTRKASIKSNPFDLNFSTDKPTETAPVIHQTAPENPTENTQEIPPTGDGAILSLTLFIIAIATFIFIFFRSLYAKVYRAISNDNQLSLLYRERTGGTIGSFFITYALFFLSAGLFIYLTLIHFNLIQGGSLFKQYVQITSLIAGLFIAKHLVLTILGYVFPITKEIKLYSFSIMVFAIIIGILLPFADLILAYSTETTKPIVIYFVGFLVSSLYLLRILRGFFIANRFVFNFSFHFLLYLCAIEIAPALILYKVIFDLKE